MNKVSLFALLLAVSFVNDTTAATKADGASFATKWNVDTSSSPSWRCQGSATKQLGISTAGTNNKWHKNLKTTLYSGSWSPGAVYYIAHEMTERGYKFCKTVISADRSNCTTDSYTQYYYNEKLTKSPDCFWLCLPGYFDDGTGCNAKTMTDMSLPDLKVHMDRKAYATDEIKLLNGTAFRYKELEKSIPMLVQDRYINCDNNTQSTLRQQTKKQEHDVILVIKKIAVDSVKNTVEYVVSPMAVRAAGTTGQCHEVTSQTAWPLATFTGTSNNTMCPGNFLHQTDETGKSIGGCVMPASAVEAAETSAAEQAEYKAAVSKAKSLEEQGLAILCQNWPKEKYDNKVHVLKAATFEYSNWRVMPENYDKADDNTNWTYGDATATCTIFRCKDGQGYAKDPTVSGDFTCVNCNTSTDTTIHPTRLGTGKDGVCKVCSVGEIVEDGICVKAKQIHKFYMGGETKESDRNVKLDVSQQCWTKPTPDEYRQCLADNGWATYAAAAPDKGDTGTGGEPSM